jgi:TPR repeat protein/Holliday junction resolvasome RuvABC ATP-dependent DNA helicase subunit
MSGMPEVEDFEAAVARAYQGDVAAQAQVGFRFEEGIGGVQQDPRKAAFWYEKSAAGGSLGAKMRLSMMCFEGRGHKQDTAKALKLAREVAELEEAEGNYCLGFMFATGGPGLARDPHQAVRLFETAAAKGHPLAQWNAGIAYFRGDGVKEDAAKAFTYFQAAAEQGYAEAQFNEGMFYQLGLGGVKKDLARAAQCFERAAEQGHVESLVQGGICLLLDPHSGEAEAKRALSRFEKADGLGHPTATFNIGCMFRDGTGIDQDYIQAARYFRKAVERGYVAGYFELGVLYENGRGVEKNLAQARECYQAAAVEGIEGAQAALAELDARSIPKVVEEDKPKVFGEFDLSPILRSTKPRVEIRNDENAGAKHAKGKQLGGTNASEVEPNAKESAIDKLESMVGLGNIKTHVRKIARSSKVKRIQGHHLIFTGNPGTGKTMVARMMGEIYRQCGVLKKGHVVVAGRSHLVAGFIGQTAEKAAGKIREALGGVLFVDNADQLYRPDMPNDYGEEAIAEIMNAMGTHKDELVVILSGYPDQMRRLMDINSGLNSQFAKDNKILFEDYSAKELVDIYKYSIASAELELENEALPAVQKAVDELLRKKDDKFGNARTVETELVEPTKDNFLYRTENNALSGERRILAIDVPEINLGPKKNLDELLAKLDGLVGLSGVKAEIRSLTNVARMNQKKANAGLKLTETSLHLVFSGKPGTGKTTVARLLGEIYVALGLLSSGHVVEVQPHQLMGGKMTEEKIKNAMDGVLFIDEAYGLLESPYGRQSITALLTALENHRNRLAVIVAGYDAEIRGLIASDPGLQTRFTRYVHFEDYTAEELTKVFLHFAASQDLKVSSEAMERVRILSEVLYQGRDARGYGNARSIRNAFQRANENMATRIVEQDLEEFEIIASDIPLDVGGMAKQPDSPGIGFLTDLSLSRR